MICAGFLDAEANRDLAKLAQDGSAEHRLGRRASASLLNNRMSCVEVAKVCLSAATPFGLGAVNIKKMGSKGWLNARFLQNCHPP
jgi:hypothetical protein